MMYIHTIDTFNKCIVQVSHNEELRHTKVFSSDYEAIEYVTWLSAFYDALEVEYSIEDPVYDEELLWEIA